MEQTGADEAHQGAAGQRNNEPFSCKINSKKY